MNVPRRARQGAAASALVASIVLASACGDEDAGTPTPAAPGELGVLDGGNAAADAHDDARGAPAIPVAVLPAGFAYARQVRNGWGVNGRFDPAKGVAALDFLGTRWLRAQFDQGGEPAPFIAATQSVLADGTHVDPNLKLELLLNDYMQNVVDGVDALPWSLQKQQILTNILPIRGVNGKSVLAAIEGPNEINNNLGGGAHGPDAIERTDDDFARAQAAFLAWSQALATFRDANREVLAGVELLSPTILYYTADGSEWPTLPDVSAFVDYGTFHYYSGLSGTNGCPSWPTNPDNFAAYYGFAHAAIAPKSGLVQSEGGASTQAGGGYAADGRSQARYMLMQLLDHFAMGGHRFMIYELFDSKTGSTYNEENFGLFESDGTTPKPAAVALHNMSNLLSLGNDWNDPANLADTNGFALGYTGEGFSIEGMLEPGAAGRSLILPKSDGTTMIAIWNEPRIDSGTGTSTTPKKNSVTVSFGSTQSYRVYDPTGGGAADFVAKADVTPIANGSASSVTIDLYGTPLLIELRK